eukprot:TRINITY_DN2354_c0_g1_i2.p1 TRINITY_DN2354_c0_g1~~TRINITY_DN2354_c0_g1_i2.p1  ORF type:complete len:343 (+),score=89.29 TRINITY_DN2354_c0_g1_i2:761-1789(+)
MELAGRASEAEAAHARVVQLEAKVEEQKGLIARLEDDIQKGSGPGDRRHNRAGGTWDSAELGHNMMADFMYAEAGGRGGSSGAGPSGNKGGSGSGEDEENSMLAVVCGQRDRFRQKTVQLEEELRRVRDKCIKLTAELERTKMDNVKLYEKIRYVQEYTKDHGGGGAGETLSSRNSKKREDDMEAGVGGGSSDVEARYRKIYEDTINPFAAFSNREKEQRYKELGLRDRITLTSGRFLLGNEYARTFIFFYSIALHLLVFLSMYSWSHVSSYSVHAKYDSSTLKSKRAAEKVLKLIAAGQRLNRTARASAYNSSSSSFSSVSSSVPSLLTSATNSSISLPQL